MHQLGLFTQDNILGGVTITRSSWFCFGDRSAGWQRWPPLHRSVGVGHCLASLTSIHLFRQVYEPHRSIIRCQRSSWEEQGRCFLLLLFEWCISFTRGPAARIRFPTWRAITQTICNLAVFSLERRYSQLPPSETWALSALKSLYLLCSSFCCMPMIQNRSLEIWRSTTNLLPTPDETVLRLLGLLRMVIDS